MMQRSEQRLSSRGRDDRGDSGAIAILTAAMALFLFGVAAFAVDIAYDYGQRRQQQNAADSGALAGAKAISDMVYGSSGTVNTTLLAASVNAAALAAVQANSGETARYSCQVVYTVVVPGTLDCATPGSFAVAGAGLPVGVKVVSGQGSAPLFSGLLGATKLVASTSATARVAALKSSSGPFVICGWGNTQKSPGAQTSAAGVSYANNAILPNILTQITAPYGINPAAVGLTYDIHGPQIDDCNQGSSFKGNEDQSQSYAIPGLVTTDNGTKAGPIRDAVANSCSGTETPDSEDGCLLVVPVCDPTPEPGSQIRCDILATFRIKQTGANRHTATLLDTPVIVAGTTSAGSLTYAQARAVQLIA